MIQDSKYDASYSDYIELHSASWQEADLKGYRDTFPQYLVANV